MLQVARLAPNLLQSSTSRVIDFLRSQINPDGGFKDRAGHSDLYYTVFGVEALFALRADLPTGPLTNYLHTFADGPALDFVHLCCLARCWAILPPDALPADTRRAILSRIDAFRTPDGGYAADAGAQQGTVYGCFL